jgi:hypothetical protein
MGINGGYKLPQNPSNIKAVNGGLLIRTGFGTNADAMAITGGFRIGRIDIGVSYDLNVSPLNEVSNYRGAFELSFAYRSISTILNSYSIPCERL